MIYALDVGWYYEERTASAVATAILAGVFSPGLLFGMGLLFFVAGLFHISCLRPQRAHGASSSTGCGVWASLRPPTCSVVDPAMNFFGDRAMGQGETVAEYFRLTYREDVEFGVAWFMAALLAFSVVYAARMERDLLKRATAFWVRESNQ